MRIIGFVLFLLGLICEIAVAQIEHQRTWALCIGISQYDDKTLTLKWADKDAINFSAFLKRDLQLDERQYYLLKNRDATRQNILQHLETLNLVATSNDKIYIFYIGHGSPSSPILPYDSNHFISMEEMTSVLSDNKAKEIIILADTSHYGKIVEDNAQIAIEQKGLTGWNPSMISEMTAVKNGIVIISGTGGDQQTGETIEFKNGFFTYHLLNTLTNRQVEADTDRDEKLTLYEVYQDISLSFAQSTMSLQLSSKEKAEKSIFLSEIVNPNQPQAMGILKKTAIEVGSIVVLGGGIALVMNNNSGDATSPQNTNLPDLIVSAVYPYFFNPTYVEFRYVIQNIGIAPAILDESSKRGVILQVILSADPFINGKDDILVREQLLYHFPRYGLAPGDSFDGYLGAFATVDVLKTPYLILRVDSEQVIDEIDETNNIIASKLEK